MAFTSTTQQLCGKSVFVPLLLLAAAAPSNGQILGEVSGLSSFGIGVSEEAFHAGIADEDCDAPALNLLQRKANYVKKAKDSKVAVSNTNSQSQSGGFRLPYFSSKTPKVSAEEADSKSEARSESQSQGSSRRLPFFSQKTLKMEGDLAEAKEGAVLIEDGKSGTASKSQSESSARKLPFFSQKTPKMEGDLADTKNSAVLIEDSKSGTASKSQSESSARKLPFFSQKTSKMEEAPKVEVFPKDIPAEAFDEDKDVAVAFFQTDVHYKAAAKPVLMNSLAVSADGSVGAATSSAHEALQGRYMTMVFGADGSVEL